MRHVLDCVAWRPRSPRDVDYFAVFLLAMRLAIATRILRRFRGDSDSLRSCGPFSELIEWCLPWHAQECDLRLRASLPTLAEIWFEMKSVLGEPPYVGQLCRVVTRRADPGEGLTPDRWYQWVRRAKRAAQEGIDPATWQPLFRPWLPERGVSEEKAV